MSPVEAGILAYLTDIEDTFARQREWHRSGSSKLAIARRRGLR